MAAIVDRLESDGVIDSNGIFLPMGSVVDPQPINCPDPQTLADSKHKSISGGIMVDFGIDAMGSVSDIQVITADPPGAFEATVFNTLQRCQFKPQLVNGRPTPTSARRVYQFNQAPDQPSKAQ
jgi:TonB family protein